MAPSYSRTQGSSPAGRPPLRILHVINQLDMRAGAEISLREFVIASQSADVVNGIVVLRGQVLDREPLDRLAVPLFVPLESPSSRLRSIGHVLHAASTFQPDLLHTSLFDADAAGRIAGRLRSVPTVTSLVNTQYSPEALQAETAPRWKLRIVKAIDRILARYATTAFHAISQATAEHAVKHLRIPPTAVRVVPRGRRSSELGVRAAQRRNTIRSRTGWDDRTVIINVAREEPQKGHELLLEAFEAVAEQHPDCLLVLVGRTGRSSAAIEHAIKRRGLTQIVQRLGERRDVADLLAAADLFAFASLYEGLGGAVVEASGLALPTVAFDVPAVVEVLGPEHPWLVPTGDATKLGETISNAILSGAERLHEIGVLQRQRFEERFEMSAVVDQELDLYRDVLRIAKTSRDGRGLIRF
jgi:glycosyltransferase involved in cell wall biosynthesis